MTFNGWAVNLNGVILATCDTQAAWDELDCFPGEVFDVLTDTPAGLDLPSLRTEDVTYPQRDGVKHFSDWYQPRFVTLVGTIGPISTDECVDGSCQTVREQLQAVAQEWKRTCCDTELVVYTDCYLTDHAENYNPPNTDGEWTTIGENLAPNPSAETEQAWVNDLAGTHTATWDVIDYYAGSKSRKSVKDSGASPLVLSLSEVGATTADDVTVLNGLTYTFSIWLMAPQADYVGTVEVEWSFDSSTTTSVDVALPAGVWTRVNVTGVCPGDGTADVRAFIGTADASPATVGHMGYADALLVEQSALLADYYDGDTPDVYDTVTESWWQFTWVGTANESTTLKQEQAATFHGSTVNGPFGIVGRPREFKYKQQYRNDQVYDFVARFDAVDQRMYVLDECGTPGYSECVNIDPGSQLFSICMTDGVCFDGAGFCFTNAVENGGSVAPTEVSVAGTELVYPTITLYPELVDPTIENITTGEWVSFDGTIGDLPVTINTEEGTAFDSEGNSLTHLLRGSLFMSMEPGNYQWRLLSSGEDVPEPGYASLCFRPTVVAA